MATIKIIGKADTAIVNCQFSIVNYLKRRFWHMATFLELLKAVLFGIVEGVTEWLPISSTGHMILLNEFVHMNVSEAFWEMFLVVIQLGAILAVVALYWNQIFPFDFSRERNRSVAVYLEQFEE